MKTLEGFSAPGERLAIVALYLSPQSYPSLTKGVRGGVHCSWSLSMPVVVRDYSFCGCEIGTRGADWGDLSIYMRRPELLRPKHIMIQEQPKCSVRERWDSIA